MIIKLPVVVYYMIPLYARITNENFILYSTIETTDIINFMSFFTESSLYVCVIDAGLYI